MANDGNTINSIEFNNHITGVANLLTKYGFAVVQTEEINLFTEKLFEGFGIRVSIDTNRPHLRVGEFFLQRL